MPRACGAASASQSGPRERPAWRRRAAPAWHPPAVGFERRGETRQMRRHRSHPSQPAAPPPARTLLALPSILRRPPAASLPPRWLAAFCFFLPAASAGARSPALPSSSGPCPCPHSSCFLAACLAALPAAGFCVSLAAAAAARCLAAWLGLPAAAVGGGAAGELTSPATSPARLASRPVSVAVAVPAGRCDACRRRGWLAAAAAATGTPSWAATAAAAPPCSAATCGPAASGSCSSAGMASPAGTAGAGEEECLRMDLGREVGCSCSCCAAPDACGRALLLGVCPACGRESRVNSRQLSGNRRSVTAVEAARQGPTHAPERMSCSGARPKDGACTAGCWRSYTVKPLQGGGGGRGWRHQCLQDSGVAHQPD